MLRRQAQPPSSPAERTRLMLSCDIVRASDFARQPGFKILFVQHIQDIQEPLNKIASSSEAARKGLHKL